MTVLRNPSHFFNFGGRGSFWTGTCYVGQAGLDSSEICLPCLCFLSPSPSHFSKGILSFYPNNLFCSTGWIQTHKDLLVSASWVLGLFVCASVCEGQKTMCRNWFSPNVDPRDGTKVIRLGSNHLTCWTFPYYLFAPTKSSLITPPPLCFKIFVTNGIWVWGLESVYQACKHTGPRFDSPA